MKSNSIIVNYLSVSYLDQGKAEDPVIIFIHGFPLDKSMWDNQMAALKDNYRVIAYDIRGHGDSEPGNGIFSIELFVNDLFGFMDSLKIHKAVLCGFSMGGYIALNAIENHPERFDALILCDTTCNADTPEGKEKRMNTIESIKENGVEKYSAESIKNLFAPESITSDNAVINRVREIIEKTSPKTLYDTLLALSLRLETCSRINEIKVPVLVMVGKEDKITPVAAAMFMHEKIPDSTLKIIDHAGHMSNLENPDEFNDHVRNFVTLVY